MHKIKIKYKNKNSLIEAFEAQESVECLKETSLITKLSFKAKEYADVYFHSGSFDKETIDDIKNAKIVITTSLKVQKEILKNSGVSEEKVKVIYPAIDENELKQKESKQIIGEQFNFDKKRKIILFTAKNFKQNGIKEFCDIIKAINYKNIQVIIAGDKNQVGPLKFQASKYGFGEEVLLIENYPDMSVLFSAADIFVLPTHINGFASNVLKAMFYKTAVFVSDNCASSEVVDVFSRLNFPNDRATPFKLDALLGNKEELKTVKRQNKKESEKYLLEHQIEKLSDFVKKI